MKFVDLVKRSGLRSEELERLHEAGRNLANNLPLPELEDRGIRERVMILAVLEDMKAQTLGVVDRLGLGGLVGGLFPVNIPDSALEDEDGASV